MKKTVFLIMMAVLVLFVAVPSPAEERKISTFILLENDWDLNERGNHKQTFYASWSGGFLGAELNVETNPINDYISIRSSLVLGEGSIYAVGGISTDSTGSDYANVGLWYFGSGGRFSVFFDGRTYWAIDGASQDYLDVYFSVKRKIGKGKAFIGLDLVFDHWWGENHNWYLAGPLLGYKITDTTSLFARISRSWDEVGNNFATTDQLRLGLELKF